MNTKRVIENAIFYSIMSSAAVFGSTKCYSSIVENYSITGWSLFWAFVATSGFVAILLTIVDWTKYIEGGDK